jgi:hypothetical protein
LVETLRLKAAEVGAGEAPGDILAAGLETGLAEGLDDGAMDGEAEGEAEGGAVATAEAEGDAAGEDTTGEETAGLTVVAAGELTAGVVAGDAQATASKDKINTTDRTIVCFLNFNVFISSLLI